MARVLDAADESAVAEAVEVLAGGGLLVAPVDGVYALVADAFSGEATAALRSLRGASAETPLTLLVRSHKQLPGVTAAIPEAAERLVAGFWPGPLTLLLPAAESMVVDLGASHGTVAVRQPADEATLAVIAGVGPLACSSAAAVGQPGPTRIADALDAFDDAVGAYLDAGELDGRRSTVVDCSRGGAEVRRRGAISADDVLDTATGLDGGEPAGPVDGREPAQQQRAEAGPAGARGDPPREHPD